MRRSLGNLSQYLHLGFVFAASLLLASTEAFAKKVSIEWKSIKGAVNYELQIEKNGKVVSTKVIDDTSWSGDLQYGAYSYQIRAIDKVKRPGVWSQPKALVVAPKAPELKQPVNGKRITLYDPTAGWIFQWGEVEGASKYAVTIRNGKRVVQKTLVQGTQLPMKGLEPGEYNWQVSAVIEATGRVPASMQGKTWESPASDDEEFEIEHKRLAMPELVYPTGVVPPGDGGKIQFEWRKVDGAEAYEIEIQDLEPSRVPAAVAATAPSKTRKYVTAERSFTIAWPGEGSRGWKVRALANIDPNKVPGAVGPQSVMQFKVSRNADYHDGSGYVAISSLLSPYTYVAKIPGGGSNLANPIATTFRLSGEYWMRPQFGAGLGGEMTVFQLQNQVFTRKTFEMTARYRAKISKDKFAWFFAPKIGAEYRDAFQIRRRTSGAGNASSVVSEQFSTIGASVGFDVRKQMSEKLSLGAKVAYYYPLMISDADSTDPALSAQPLGLELNSWGANRRNLSVGLQGLYWVGPRIGLAMGVFGEMRSVGYHVSDARMPDDGGALDGSVTTDAVHLFGSLIYTFGN